MSLPISPIQLDHYIVPRFGFHTNPNFDPGSVDELPLDNFEVEHDVRRNPDQPDKWSVDLRIRQNLPEDDTCFPYAFSLHLLGLFTVLAEDWDDEQVEKVIGTNAPSMLFGVARELVRNFTSAGPHAPLLLPSISFHPSAPSSDEEE